MGSFVGIFFELGLGIAIGMIAGTTGLQGSARGRMALLAAVIGLVVGFLLAGGADLTGPVGAVVCLAGAVFAFLVVSDVVHGAGRREGGGGGSGALGFIVALAALIVVVIAVLVPLVVILILALLIWLALARRRRAQRKHAGLRVLR